MKSYRFHAEVIDNWGQLSSSKVEYAIKRDCSSVKEPLKLGLNHWGLFAPRRLCSSRGNKKKLPRLYSENAE